MSRAGLNDRTFLSRGLAHNQYMLFKMILDGAKDEERPIARGFLKHVVAGFAGGLAFGGIVLAGLLLTFSKMDLHVPVIFLAAAMLQFGPIGGLVGVGIHLSRITDRSAPDSPDSDEDDDGPRGGTKAPATEPRRPGRVRSFPLPVRA